MRLLVEKIQTTAALGYSDPGKYMPSPLKSERIDARNRFAGRVLCGICHFTLRTGQSFNLMQKGSGFCARSGKG